MYIPPYFEEARVEVLHALMRTRPFATLVTLSSGGINANHVPLHLSDGPEPFGTLRGHVARANPVWCDLAEDVEALAIFQGPNRYITPSWYPSKREDGKAVPTWNYTVVHAYGALRVIDDPTWLRSQIETLVTQHEASFTQPWSIADAPRDYTDRMIGAVVGIEMVVTRLAGKWKLSQNQTARNRAGVISGLEQLGSADALEMAALIEEASRNSREHPDE